MGSGSGEHPIRFGFAYGDGPFKVKGTAYRGLQESFDARVPGGMAAVVAKMNRPEVRAFFSQPFLPGSTYDLFPLLEASQVAARIQGTPWPAFVREGSRLQAERDLNGVYRTLLRLASPGLVVERLPRILRQYMAFADVAGEIVGEGRFEAVATGIPAPATPWMLAMAEGFVPVLMKVAGAKEVAVIVHPREPQGTELGVPIETARFSISWF